MLADLIRFLTRAVSRCFYHVEVEGLDKVPRTGPLIVACNHLSNVDPLLLDMFIGRIRPVRFMAKIELFRLPIGYAMQQVRAIPVDRKRSGGAPAALKGALEALEAGDCIAMFPEGTRARPGKPLEPKPGIGFLALKGGAPVLVARMFGTGRFPFTRNIKFKVGGIYKFESAGCGDDTKAAYSEVSRKVMSEIMSITEENAPSAKA
jgi:1-acyl-sn-glycerol-3-phosphate acyltransferase